MRNLRLYYSLKTMLPRPFQIRLRQMAARRKRRHVADVWPILESAGQAPEGWKGWPEGKRFALVLTHDVETRRGLDRCRMLMDVEERKGFRSAFNFVPQRYDLTHAMREEMAQRGFEIAIHGLRHDLSLFRSEKEFKRQAVQINDYLDQWGARGFRCPYMIRNLNWIRDHLSIEYDSSTFDTDPFEPRPEGVNTIFPFMINSTGNGRPGYVEMPCTLPQDLCLFVLLGESGIEVWKRKLDWIAARGGMALIDTHPDYMSCGAAVLSDEYPARLYEEFLEYARSRYGGQYWHALPRAVATFCRSNPESVRHGSPKRVCMVAYSFYDTDGRIMRYAETLVREGHTVDAISLGREGQPQHEVVNGVGVERIQRRTRDEKGQFTYLARMIRFFFTSSWTLALKHSRIPYDVVHVHSVPDFEVFAAWFPKLGGARLILDIHDLVPEFYASKFRVGTSSLAYKILLLLERVSAHFADHVIIANDIWRDRLVGRSIPAEKCTVVLNNVDPAVFFRRERTRDDDRFIVVYPGGLQWHQGVDIVLRAFARIAERLPNTEFHVYGDGSEREALKQLACDLHLDSRFQLKEPVPFREVPLIMANADLGIVAKRADSFGNEAYSTKIMEYMSQGIPVVVSRTKIDTYYFDDSVVRFFESGNDAELAETIVGLSKDPELRRKFSDSGLAYVARNDWNLKKHEYLELVESACNAR